MANIETTTKNWQTTVCGVLIGISMCISQLINMLDSDPETVFQISIFLAGLGAMGIGIFAKDGDKTSENIGLKVFILCFVLFFAGCYGVQMTPRYRQATEMAAITVGALNEECQAGDPNACRDGLDAASETLNLIVDALHGRDSDGTD